MSQHPSLRTTVALLIAAAIAPTFVAAATIKKADDTVVTGRLVTIRDGKLVVAPAPAAKSPTAAAATGAKRPTTAPATQPLAALDKRLATTGPTTRTAVASNPPANSATRPAATAPAEIEIPLEDLAEVSPLLDPGSPATPAAAEKKAIPPTTRTAAATGPASAPATTAPVADTRPWKLKLADGQAITLIGGTVVDGRLCGTIVGGRVALAIPVSAVREWWCGANDQLKLAAALNEPASTDDIAYAARDKNVLAVHGVAIGVEGSALKFKFGGQERSIALNRLVGIVYAKSPGDAPKAAAVQVATCASGDVLSGTWTGLDANTIAFTTTWGQAITLRRADVTKITFRNGRVVSLSDLTPTDVKQTPYFDRLLPWQADKALDGKPLQLSDGPVARGIAMHSKSALSFALGGEFAEFKSHVGFQQPDGRLGDAVVRVIGDGRTLFQKGDAKGTEPPFDVSVSVAGVQKLTIEVDFGQGQDVGDRVVWGSARVIRPAAK